MTKNLRVKTLPKMRFDKHDLEFEVREVNGRAYVVLKESRKGSISLQQQMTFGSHSDFEKWCVMERRRLEFPLAYDQLAKSVYGIFKPQGGV